MPPGIPVFVSPVPSPQPPVPTVFVDRVTIEIAAGNGGDGCVSFRREKYIPRGGPDGGDGGDGGSIIVVAQPGVDTLSELAHRKQWRAERGENGTGKQCHGRNAKDLIIKVPPGTIIMDAKHGHVLKDLSTLGETVVAARGGRGGKGNTRFKSATNQAPRDHTRGEEGESRRVTLELKVIADIGLVGKPNAGKSTLLSRVSRARPEIADYPFTTKIPHLGIVQLDMDRSLVIADIPGLIEGAHAGVGLGHEFLRHVERTRVLIHLVEPEPVDGTDPIENYRTIRSELEQYGHSLENRREIVAVSKAELPSAAEVQEKLAAASGRDVILFSSVTGQGLDRLLQAAHTALMEARSESQ